MAGYTNAGKSTLFNLLTNADVFAEDKLFATLDSTTRTLDSSKKEKLLISDTVGFIRKLPPHLVASFKSTLNEVRDADIILHVIDISHPYFEDQVAVVENTLKELRCENKTQIKVFNKVDILNDRHRIPYVKNKYPDSVIISAKRGINITQLRDKLLEITGSAYIEENIDLNLNESKKAAKIHALAEVLSTEYDDEMIHIKYRTNRENSEKIKKIVSKV
jgi:GTP-binding protein HflX